MFFLISAIVSAELVRSSCSERFLFCTVLQLSICILLSWSSVCSLLFLQFGPEFLVGVITMSIGTGLLLLLLVCAMFESISLSVRSFFSSDISCCLVFLCWTHLYI